MTEIIFEANGLAQWAGMGNYRLIAPDRSHRIEIFYAGEPPHGDSYHRVEIDGRVFPGYAWGCLFAFSPCSRYAAFSWMAVLHERKTVVVDIEEHSYTVLPKYFHDFVLRWPWLRGTDEKAADACRVDRCTRWHPY